MNRFEEYALRKGWTFEEGAFVVADRPAEKKFKILEMARSGEDRPNQKTKLGEALRRYLSPSSNSYDPEFKAQLE